MGDKDRRGRPRGNIATDKTPRCEATEGNNNGTSEYFWRAALPVSRVEPPAGEQWESFGEVEKKSVGAWKERAAELL